MSKQCTDLLQNQMQEAWENVLRLLDGLDDNEFFWEPVPGCWTVRRGDDQRWTIDYALPEPEPAPFTTIAWRVVHLASCKVMYHEYAFGPAQLEWDELPIPHTAASALDWLKQGHDLLRRDLTGMTDTDLIAERLTNWGESWPSWRIFWAMIHHDAHHAGEIGVLRDLYRAYKAG